MITVIRSMQYIDISAVMEIETSAYSYPWSRQNFKDCLQSNYIAKILELNHILVGYGIMSVAVEEAQILNLCVKPNQQHRGYARQIIEQLQKCAKQKHTKSVFLEVRVSNIRAINLYHQSGFNQVGLRKNYYPNGKKGREDALILAKEID